ncbi:ATPase synthesis protein 25 mitochondrial [Elasticomyces elasticus]|nr:ATPase synthesis protein 25 mitochondrial [Elasticomyces elasticus]
MSLVKGVSTLTCQSCRQLVFRSFATAAGTPWRIADHPPRRLENPYQRRGLSAKPALRQDEEKGLRTENEGFGVSDQLIGDELETEKSEQEVQEVEEQTPQPPHSDGPVPWYLQVSQPQRAQHPISERQRRPGLPSLPPPLMQPLLQHVSVELGMDDLTLIDLRALDPPPALGANLLMLIGTARSEKHLHVSADRLCRWLRAEYGLKPFADGLLGRNELKLKMRRKAKRSRLLSAVGAKETSSGNLDDGIRTGWVCVNVGRVEGADVEKGLEAQEEEHEDDFVGFGTRKDGVRIVVQMLTEEKRGDMDLEGLWNGILRRSNKKQERERKEDEELAMQEVEGAHLAAHEQQVTTATTMSQSPIHTSTSHFTPAPHVSNGRDVLQARAFHTTARRRVPESARPTRTDAAPHRAHEHDADSADSSAQASNMLLHSATTPVELLGLLKSLPSAEALKALGDDPLPVPSKSGGLEDTSDTPYKHTPFMTCFYQSLPSPEEETYWTAHLQLCFYAHGLSHPRYTKEYLQEQSAQMQYAGFVPDAQAYTALLKVVLAPRDSSGSVSDPADAEKDYQDALDLLEEMEAHGHPVVTDEVFELLQRATVPPSMTTTASADTGAGTELGAFTSTAPDFHQLQALHSRLLRATTLLLPPTPALTAQLLRKHITPSDPSQPIPEEQWRSVWQAWALPPLNFLPRPPALYTLLFTLVARMQDQKRAIEALRCAVPDLEREEPRVPLEGEVAESVLRCLSVAEPGAEQMGRAGGRGEWGVLWRRAWRGVGGVV